MNYPEPGRVKHGSRDPVEQAGTDSTEADRDERRDDLKWAAGGGIVAAAVGFGGMLIVGTVDAFDARRLVEAVLPTVRFAASAYVAAGATILALMLTLITFSISHDLEFRTSHYRRIRDIAALTTAVIVASVMLLMFLSFPLDEAGVEHDAYQWVYYTILFGGAVTGGALISVILMLFYAVRQLITVGEDVNESPLVITEDDPGTGNDRAGRD